MLDRLNLGRPTRQPSRNVVVTRPPSLARPRISSQASTFSLLSRTESSSALNDIAENGTVYLSQDRPLPEAYDAPSEVLIELLTSAIPDPDIQVFEAKQDLSFAHLVDFSGVSLEDYAGEPPATNDQDADESSSDIGALDSYINEQQKVEEFHNSIQMCDQVLHSVESLLAAFQKDLGLVSQEIESLQNRSVDISNRLQNRCKVEAGLGPAVEQISLPPAIVSTIIGGNIDPAWVRALAELDKRLKPEDAASVVSQAQGDLDPMLRRLKDKAIERIRDYLAAQIKALRVPNANISALQQNQLMRYRTLFAFLHKHNVQLSEGIVQAYANTMQWYYSNGFTRYRTSLDGLALLTFDKYDSLGSDSSQRTRPSGNIGTHDAHNIGRRHEVLKTDARLAVVGNVAESDKGAYCLETPFYNLNLALMDNLVAEYTFFTAFFSSLNSSQMSHWCSTIFSTSFNIGLAQLKDLIEGNGLDCFGIMLCIRLVQIFAFDLQKKRVPVADDYINALNIQLWPKFQAAMDLQIDSIRALVGTISSSSAASKLSTIGVGSDASKQSTAPHFLTQRFGGCLYGILLISPMAGEDEPLARSLDRLRMEYSNFILKLSKAAFASDAKKRIRFLENNYLLVETILADVRGKLADDTFEWLKIMRSNHVHVAPPSASRDPNSMSSVAPRSLSTL